MKKIFIVVGLSIFFNQHIVASSVCSVVDIPGVYNYGSIEADPTDNNDAIICITVSNVVIDLGDGIYNQLATNRMGGFDGIRIDPNLSNITIKNGTINGVTGIGISVGAGCSDITIENVVVTNCNTAGIWFAGTAGSGIIQDGSINNCLVSSCTGSEGQQAYGMRLVQCDNIGITNCRVKANDAGAIANGFGISLDTCTSCNLINCEAENNGGDVVGVGISLSNCQWTVVDHCTINGTIARDTSAVSKAVGFLVAQCDHTSISNCISIHNNNLNANGYGFQASNGSDNLFTLCLSQNNQGNIVAAGFAVDGTEIRTAIFECQSRVNDGGVAGAGYGIYLNGSLDCDIWYNELIGNIGLTGYGLRDTTTNTTNLIAGNAAFGNTTNGYLVPRTTGTFPVLSATVGGFSTITSASKYMNISFS